MNVLMIHSLTEVFCFLFPIFCYVFPHNPSCSNQGVVFMEGKKCSGVKLPITQGKVFERLPPDHNRKKYYRLHFDLAAGLFQFPHLSGVPVLDITTVSDTGREESVPIFSQNGSERDNWPTVMVEGESCCVFQLLGLTQFPVVPRHPQSQNPKYINWGMQRGLVVTYLYHCWAAAAAASSSASNPIQL